MVKASFWPTGFSPIDQPASDFKHFEQKGETRGQK